MFNLEPLRKTHQNCQLPFSCIFPQPFISARIWLRQLLHGMGSIWEKFELGRAPILEECVLTPWARKHPKIHTPIPSCINVFHLPSHFWGEPRDVQMIHLHSQGRLGELRRIHSCVGHSSQLDRHNKSQYVLLRIYASIFPFAETLVAVLQRYTKLQSVMRPYHLCIKVNPMLCTLVLV